MSRLVIIPKQIYCFFHLFTSSLRMISYDTAAFFRDSDRMPTIPGAQSPSALPS